MKKRKLTTSNNALRDHLTDKMVYFDLKISDVARIVSLSQRTVRRFLDDEVEPTIETRLKLLNFVFNPYQKEENIAA